jgi:hypothetical protein
MLLCVRHCPVMNREYPVESTYRPYNGICSRIDEIDIENFNRIMKMHANFQELISAFKQEPDAYDSFVAIVDFFSSSIFCTYMRINPLQLVHAMGDARAQDTNLIRYEIPKYIPLNYKTESLMPPITGGEKSGRGFAHPVIGKLLCPLRYLDRFKDDPM